MAENDDQNLVSEIKVTGGEEASAQVEKFADDSADALGKLGDAAEKASDKVEKSTDKIVKNYRKVGQGAKAVGDGAPEIDRAGISLQQLERYTSNFTASIPKTVQRVSDFAKRLAVLGTAAVAAGVGLVAAARKVSQAVDGQSDALDKQTSAQVDANNAALSAEIAQINYQSSLRQLNQQLATGAISYMDYAKQVQALNQNYREQQRVANETAAAQQRVKEENERLQKTVADRKAYNALIDTLGGPLVTALSTLGRDVEQIRKRFVDAFGPSAAAVVDTISAVISKNSGAIGSFFDNASKKIQDLLTKNGPAIQKLLENIGKAAANVFQGLIDAAPAMIDFFNNQITPAIQNTMAVLNSFAELVNSIFGTKLTGGFIVLVAILGSVTGAFKALFAVSGLVIRGLLVLAGIVSASLGVSLLTAIGIIAAVGAALYLLVTQVDWNAWAATIVAAWNAVKTGASTAILGIQAAWSAIVGWFQSTIIQPIVAFFTQLWLDITTGVSVAIAGIQALWGAIVGWFQSAIIDPITAAFQTAADTIKGYWQSAIDGIKGFFSDLYASAQQYLKPIIDLLQQILGLNAQASSDTAGAAGGGQFASGGNVRGPGTGTSDSIPAWLSNGEFVMRAAAVRKYGSNFMHAINAGRFRDGGLALAVGGIAGSAPASPARAYRDVAGDGPASMSPLNLTLFGEQFDGLMMPEDVGRRLTKLAIKKQTSSAGRKPSWVGGGRN